MSEQTLTLKDMDIIYTKLGNDVNRPLCEKFVDGQWI